MNAKQEKTEIDELNEKQQDICEDVYEIMHSEFNPTYLEEISELQTNSRQNAELSIDNK